MSERSLSSDVIHVHLNRSSKKKVSKKEEPAVSVEFARVDDGIGSFISFQDWLEFVQSEKTSHAAKAKTLMNISS